MKLGFLTAPSGSLPANIGSKSRRGNRLFDLIMKIPKLAP